LPPPPRCSHCTRRRRNAIALPTMLPSHMSAGPHQTYFPSFGLSRNMNFTI
jgi:hypothetical protein